MHKMIKINIMNDISQFSYGISILEITYVIASVLFIIGLKMLSHPLTARKGNILAAIGMVLAIVATILFHQKDGKPIGNIGLILAAIASWYNYWLVNCQKGENDRNASACFIV